MSNWGTGSAGSPAGTITQSEVDALAGTSGTPSSTNEYVTDQDSRLTANAFLDLFYFGDGSDSSSSPSSGTVTLVRDMNYTTLTPSGTAQFVMNGFAIRCSVNLDVSNAPSTCFTQRPILAATNISGSPGSGSTAGGGGTGAGRQAIGGIAGISVGWGNGIGTGGSGGNAGTSPGQPTGITISSMAMSGGRAGVGGVGGAASVGNSGGLAGVFTEAQSITQIIRSILPMNSASDNAITLRGGFSGTGGGGGATATTSGTGGGGGGGGGGGSVMPIFARTITRAASTGAGFVDVTGGVGGAGASGTTVLNQGGGGAGGGGGGGGFVHICYRFLAGASKSGAIVATGGAGGLGGDGGGSSAKGGTGGTGGDGGVIQLVNINTGVVTRTIGSSGSPGTVATVQAGTSGGTGGACTATL